MICSGYNFSQNTISIFLLLLKNMENHVDGSYANIKIKRKTKITTMLQPKWSRKMT